MEIYCQRCGAPWNIEDLFVKGGSKGTHLGTRSSQAMVEGHGCPKCQWGQSSPRDRPVRAEMMQIARETFGDNLPKIALELHKMKREGLLNEII